ncbi:hypothetical protein KNP414_01620 [Paenibacillus mucilaginosus KNP414]|uniref:Uncharacterized protein n=1 Tax=Paenibacillus mucilaginosus (strain KNP414) TaxID=1036673 RepID=F8FPF9_PAEMK|nr:hypothetical protein KNP414_01620 [Paenibacillus mucilaginosus KNP414]
MLNHLLYFGTKSSLSAAYVMFLESNFLIYGQENRIMPMTCQVIFRFYRFFIEKPIAKPKVGLYNDNKNFN